MTKIVVICPEKICRSPLTEGVLSPKLSKNKFIIDSAGTDIWRVIQRPDRRAINVAGKHGIDIYSFVARQFDVACFVKFDHVYLMHRENYHTVIRIAPNENIKHKIKMILSGICPSKNKSTPKSLF